VSIFVVIYRFLPNGEVPLARVLPAALATGILTEVGKGIYFLTLPMFRFREVYGPYALSVTLLFWAYVGALILLFGAHLSARGLGQRMFVRDALRPNHPVTASPQGGS
jgi:membrane protein